MFELFKNRIIFNFIFKIANFNLFLKFETNAFSYVIGE